MKLFKIISSLALGALLTGSVNAQEAPGKKKLAITKIAPTESVKARMAKQGVGLSLGSVLEALDSQVYDRVLNTKRFEILERSDADALAKELSSFVSAYGEPIAAVVKNHVRKATIRPFKNAMCEFPVLVQILTFECENWRTTCSDGCSSVILC